MMWGDLCRSSFCIWRIRISKKPEMIFTAFKNSVKMANLYMYLVSRLPEVYSLFAAFPLAAFIDPLAS
jgi:hypothetical protein